VAQITNHKTNYHYVATYKMTEIELQLRLDPEGRTAFDASASFQTTTSTNPIEKKRKAHHDTIDDSTTTASGSSQHETEIEQNVTIASDDDDGNEVVSLDYSSRTVYTGLSDDSKFPSFGSGDDETKTQFLDELLFDCEVADCALMPRTFWVPAKGMKPRCALEQCALEVFHHHVKQGFVYDEERSGCEWWVQIRPSPPAGRYTILCSNNTKTQDNDDTGATNDEKPRKNEISTTTTNNTDNLEKKGICFHWDKDEDLRLLMDGKMYIHPHISTVSYLSNIGAPTMALNYRVNPLTGDYMSPPPTEVVESYISWPKLGKHLSFDGRYLHAAPYDLIEEGVFEKQIDVADLKGLDETVTKKVKRRRRRVTFLVNVWLNYKPFNVEIFPDTMVDKLSQPVDTHILFNNNSNSRININNCIKNRKNSNGLKLSTENRIKEECTVEHHSFDGSKSKATSEGDVDDDLKDFRWALGNGMGERIEMQLPLKSVQRNMKNGGDICLTYGCQSEKERAVRLVKEATATTSTTN